jgi:hypothetical protein
VVVLEAMQIQQIKMEDLVQEAMHHQVLELVT